MAEASPTTRRNLFAIATAAVVATSTPASAATGDIDQLDAELTAAWALYSGDDDDAFGPRVAALETALARHPCNSRKAAAAKLRHLILPAVDGALASHLDEFSIVEDVIAFLEAH